MLDTVLLILMTSIGVAAIAMAITKAKVGEPLRNLIAKANLPMLTYMSSCPFCTGFWIAAIWTVFAGADITIGLAVWGTQTLFVGLMMRSLFLHEAEIGMMQDEINGLREEAANAYELGFEAGQTSIVSPAEPATENYGGN